MSIIQFDPTTTRGIRRNWGTIFTPRLLTGLLLAAVFCLGLTSLRAQDSVGGKPGRANFRSVINFKGTAFLEQRHGTNNIPRHAGFMPYPEGAPGFSDAAPRDPQAQRSTAPERQGIVSPNSIEAFGGTN